MYILMVIKISVIKVIICDTDQEFESWDVAAQRGL